MNWTDIWILILLFLAFFALRIIFLFLVFFQERFEFAQNLKERAIKDDYLHGNCKQKDAYEQRKESAEPHHDAFFLHKSLKKHEEVENLGCNVDPHHHDD